MKSRVWFLLIACVALSAACKSGATLPALTNPESSTARASYARTTAWGMLVDDPSGKPLANVPVRLESWEHGCVKTSPHTASCPGYLRWHTTTMRNGRFRLKDVPNGDYLLVIGSDSPADLTRPTIHDHIKLSGGVRRLQAPTLPAIPCDRESYMIWCRGVAPSPGVTPLPRPLAERQGNYRLTSVDATRESPCAVEFNVQRAHRHLPLTVIDEWLTENSREILEYRIEVPKRKIPQAVPYLIGLGESTAAGGNNCVEFVDTAFVVARAQALDARTRWLAASWSAFDQHTEAAGVAQFPPDVRVPLRQLVGPWP
jgi:hypothetical protein